MRKLKEYLKKRNLRRSGEPAAKLGKGKMRFVVQKHAATHLHYDFRLEAGGVLKSWAVPKGPSLKVGERRLAIQVEDHPLAYRNFEGVIPEGYGAGRVWIWDKGTYKGDVEEGIERGSLHLTLKGQKLKGTFLLVRMDGEKWLLIKKKEEKRKVDKFAKEYGFLLNVDKVYWPKEKITKGELLNYYAKMAKVILPYLKGRPESLRRFPDGISGKSFFQKNVKNAPEWAKTMMIKGINYLMIDDVRSLLYAVNLGCIELHPFFSRRGSLERPDFMVFDLDPVDVSFDRVVETARVLHDVLEKIGVPNYCKTSGSRGLHICVPLRGGYSYEEAKYFAMAVAAVVHKKYPKFTSLERMPSKRKGKVYIDCFQNNRGQTIAAPYCVRARAGAPVSMPLEWNEVKKGLKPEEFNLFNSLQRVEKNGDMFKPLLKKKANLKQAIRKLEKL